MDRRVAGIFISLLLLVQLVTAQGQEVLRASKIIARANRKNLPALGLPQRKDGEIDAIIRFRNGKWEGADSIRATPVWNMFAMREEIPVTPKELGAVMKFCRGWAEEKPEDEAHIVYGPLRGGWFAAVCKKTGKGLGWKSLAFFIPPEGTDPLKSIYDYSDSVNLLEYLIGYNLFPKLPSHIQESIEGITASELLCPFQENELELDEPPEPEIDYEWEHDYRY